MKTEAEQQLAKLVGMPTITEDITANDMCLDYIGTYLRVRGMHTEYFRFGGHGALVAATRPNNAKHPAVMLAAHIDVMSAEEALFTLQQQDGKLMGRGVFDMKFAVAGYMQLVDDLHKEGTLDAYDFAIMLTTDEEFGARHGYSGVHELLKLGYGAEVFVLPDSSAAGWDIEKQAKTSWRFELVAEGRAAHGSRPWEGESASFKLVHALHEIKEHFKDHGPNTDTLNIGIIHGGEAFNKIPSLMTASLEIRLVERSSYKPMLAVIKDICERHGINYVEKVVNPAPKTDLENPVVVAYLDSVEHVTGRRPQPIISAGGSDARFLAEHNTAYILSCPIGAGHHSPNEWIDHASFLQFVPILHDYLKRVAA